VSADVFCACSRVAACVIISLLRLSYWSLMAANKVVCSVCDIRFNCGYLKINDTELAIYTASGKSSYKCEAKLLKTSKTDETPVKMQRSLSASDVTKKVVSPERQLNLPPL
jgi:hypothetical protein